jgi:hypothetical protein
MHTIIARKEHLLAAIFLFALSLAPRAWAQTVTLFDGHEVCAVLYDTDNGPPIQKAANLLAHDLKALSGSAPAISTDTESAKGDAVVIGLASSPKIAALLKANNISTSPIAGKWETYGRAVIPAPWGGGKKVLVIFGSDVRGTIWGVIDLTREMGVSAWEWWADVSIRKVGRIAVDAGLRYSKEPSVKYRGFFINSGGVQRWAKGVFDPAGGGLGPKPYARVFELMWRLKANVLWPAFGSNESAFNAIPENYEVAKEYAIVRGSSHVEMMLRDNQSEWNEKTMVLTIGSPTRTALSSTGVPPSKSTANTKTSTRLACAASTMCRWRGRKRPKPEPSSSARSLPHSAIYSRMSCTGRSTKSHRF